MVFLCNAKTTRTLRVIRPGTGTEARSGSWGNCRVRARRPTAFPTFLIATAAPSATSRVNFFSDPLGEVSKNRLLAFIERLVTDAQFVCQLGFSALLPKELFD